MTEPIADTPESMSEPHTPRNSAARALVLREKWPGLEPIDRCTADLAVRVGASTRSRHCSHAVVNCVNDARKRHHAAALWKEIWALGYAILALISYTTQLSVGRADRVLQPQQGLA